jgi:hypothetical protein
VTGGRPRPPLTEAEKQAALKFSQCMRTHGVPNSPDPVFAAKRDDRHRDRKGEQSKLAGVLDRDPQFANAGPKAPSLA